MNFNSLKISLRSLIDCGNRINDGKIDEMFVREYIESYGKTKDYVQQVFNYDPEVKSLSKKLPHINYKTFRHPYYLFKTFLLNVRAGYRGTGGTRMTDIFEIDTYPARTEYFNNLTVNILLINDIFKKIIVSVENKQNE